MLFVGILRMYMIVHFSWLVFQPKGIYKFRTRYWTAASKQQNQTEAASTKPLPSNIYHPIPYWSCSCPTMWSIPQKFTPAAAPKTNIYVQQKIITEQNQQQQNRCRVIFTSSSQFNIFLSQWRGHFQTQKICCAKDKYFRILYWLYIGLSSFLVKYRRTQPATNTRSFFLTYGVFVNIPPCIFRRIYHRRIYQK